MLWSRLFAPTLRENPVEAEAAHHRLLLRAGYMRQAGPGNYAFLPLGQRSLEKIQAIVRTEMDAIGAHEFRLPVLEPGASGEIVSAIARGELRSPKQLPQIWYRIQIQFRDDARAKSDPLHARQSLVMESYSFDADAPDSEKLRGAFERIFARCGLAVAATASEFMVLSDAGDDVFVRCDACGYLASLDTSVSSAASPLVDDPDGDHAPEEFYTPGRKTIAEVSEFAQVPPTSQMKSLVMVADGKPLLALVRGDHQVSRAKLAEIFGVREVVPAQPSQIQGMVRRRSGSLGPVGVRSIRIVPTQALSGRRNMIAGANRNIHICGMSHRGGTSKPNSSTSGEFPGTTGVLHAAPNWFSGMRSP